jgi:hypothetical protein
VGRDRSKRVLTEGNEDNEELQRGENIIFVSFVIFCLESSVRFLPYFWFALSGQPVTPKPWRRWIRGCSPYAATL